MRRLLPDVIVNGNDVKKKLSRAEKPANAAGKSLFFRVAARPGAPMRGFLVLRTHMIPVILGRSGIRHDKREGDGATPAGRWRPLQVRWRRDRLSRPMSRLASRPTRLTDGWCDDPASARYNQPVRLPFKPSHEEMWRADALYDLVVVLDHNTRPRKARGGSAVFLHLAREDGAPTAGCIAFRRADLRRLLGIFTTRTRLQVG